MRDKTFIAICFFSYLYLILLSLVVYMTVILSVSVFLKTRVTMIGKLFSYLSEFGEKVKVKEDGPRFFSH